MSMTEQLAKRMLVFQIDNWADSGQPQRNKLIVPNPIASSFKVTNGKFIAQVTVDELGVEVKCFDRDGREERWASKKLGW